MEQVQSKVVKVAELQAVFTEKVFNLDLFFFVATCNPSPYCMLGDGTSVLKHL